MEKRSSTVSARIPSDLEFQLQAIALVRCETMSDLIFHALVALVQEERDRYLKLRHVFDGAPDIPSKSVEIATHQSAES